MKRGKMFLALAAGLCVATISAVSVNAGGYVCDSCGRGIMNDYTEEKDVHTIGETKCTHHKYGMDQAVAGMRRSYDQCSECKFIVYDGDWKPFTRTICHGFD